MKINVNVTGHELSEMGFDENGLIEHIIDTLDADEKELVGYDVSVNVSGNPE